MLTARAEPDPPNVIVIVTDDQIALVYFPVRRLHLYCNSLIL